MIRVFGLAALVAVIGCGPSAVSVHCCNEAPSLTFDAPRAGTLVPGDTLRIQGWVSAGAKLELSLNDGKPWSTVPVTGERFDAKVALPVGDGLPLELSLRATGAGGKVTRAAVKVKVDNVAPVVTLDPQPTQLNGSATDGSGLASLSVNGVAIDGFPYAWPAPRQVGVTAVDLAGNRTVVVAGPQPVLTIDAPVEGAIVGGTVTVRGTAAGVDAVQVTLGAAMAVDVPVVDGAWSIAWTPPPGLDFVAQTIGVAAGSTTGESRHVTVDVVAPVLKVLSPVLGARLNAADFSNGDGVEVKVSVTDGDPQASANNGTVVTSPLDNPTSYARTVVAVDRAGNVSVASVAFAVDRVAPAVVARVPAVESRNVATVASVELSEDVTGGPGLIISAGSGAWTTARHFEVTGLEADAVYASTVGAVVDAFGNPVAGGAVVRFHTAPKVPVTGVLANDVWQFEAAADADGVLTLVTTSPSVPATYRWLRADPKTGTLADVVPPMVGLPFTEVAAYADAQVQSDLSARRISAATTVRQGPFVERRALTREGAAPVVVTPQMVGVVPRAAFAAEGPGLADVGFLRWSGGTTAYARGGMVDLVMAMDAPTAMGFAANRWEAISVRNGVFQRRTFSCSTSCSLGALQQWNDVGADPSVSFAVADACTVSSYDTLSAFRRLRIEKPDGAQVELELPQVEQVRVARDNAGGFVAAKRVAGGVKLMRMACDGTFTDVPNGIVAVPVNGAFEPIALGKAPALLYVDSGFTLKAFVP